MKAKKNLMIGAALVCCIGTLVWYVSVSGTESLKIDSSANDIEARPIPTTLVTEAGTEVVRMFPGTVKARNSVDLAFSVDGVLVELNGREGRVVHEGDVLARLDARDFRNAYDAAKASYSKAAADFKRSDSLFKREVISQAEYDTAKTARDVAMAEYRIREKALEDTVIKAPYDGVIAQRYVENRQHVKKQVAVLGLHDISEVEVVIQVPERLMAQGGIEKFNEISVRFDVGGQHWFHGEINEYSVQSDMITHTYAVAVRIQAPADLKVLPGMTATVRATLGKGRRAINALNAAVGLVPVESVYSGSDGKSYIWLIPELAGAPEKQEVEVGAMSGNKIEIISGIVPGCRIATAGIHSLNEKMVVRPMRKGQEGLDG